MTKILGIVFMLWGAARFYILRRREALLPVNIGQALLSDLAVLRWQICTRRTSLPEICGEILSGSLAAPYIWEPLNRFLRDAGTNNFTLPDCWACAAENLPPPLGRMLAPLGVLFPAGGERLAAAIDETREELGGYLRAETLRQANQGRLTAALCLSGAFLAILVLI